MRLARFLCCPLGMAICYFLLAQAAVSFARFSGGVALAWVSSALLAGRLIPLAERRWLPWLASCAIASTLVTGLWGLGWAVALPLAAINIAEAAGAAYVWRRITAAFWPEDTLEWVASFYIGIGLTVPLLSGAFAAATTWLALGMDLVDNFTHWIIGHSLGLLSFLPVFHFIYQRLGRARSFLPEAGDLPKATLVIGTFVIVTVMVFWLDMRALLIFPLVYLVVATALLPPAIVILLPVILTVTGGVMSVLGHGPIAAMPIEIGDRMQFFQLYVGVAVLAALPVACDRKRRVLEMRRMHDRIAELERGGSLHA